MSSNRVDPQEIDIRFDQDPDERRNLRKKGITVDDASLKCIIDMLWNTYDADNSGALDKKETKLFLKEALGNFGSNNRLNDSNFEKVFAEFDQDNSGTIERSEMADVIKQLLNANQGVVNEKWQILKSAATMRQN